MFRAIVREANLPKEYTMSFYINTVMLSDTSTFQLEHPVNGPIFAGENDTLPVMIEVYGKASKVFRNYMATQARKNALKQKSGKADKTPTAEEVLESNAEFYATITKSITNLKMGDVEVDNFEAFKEMYANPKLDWVTTQVGQIFGEVDSFLSA